MRPLSTTVLRNEPVVGSLMRLSLQMDALATVQAGQGLALLQPGALAMLAHPFPVATIDAPARTTDVLYDTAHILAPWLALLGPGAIVDALGPWGRPFPIDRQARHAVLLGAGRRLVGLLALAAALARDGVAVVVLHDAPTATELLPPALLPPAAEYHVATLDGSAGIAGDALELLPPLLPWADTLYAALPAASYAPLRDLVHRHRLRPRRGFATVLAEAPLACYAAACDGCAVPTRDGYALLCKDGPAFDLLSLE